MENCTFNAVASNPTPIDTFALIKEIAPEISSTYSNLKGSISGAYGYLTSDFAADE